MIKKIFIVLLILISSLLLVSCNNDDAKSSIIENEYNEYIPTTYNFDYIYVEEGFEFDVEPYLLDDDSYIIPDFAGMNRAEIKYIMDKIGASYSFEFDNKITYSDDEKNKFSYLSSDLKAGDVIKKNKFVYVYTTVLPLTKHYYLDLVMDLDYEGKSFIEDGVGEVTLTRCVDGDTAYFKDSTGENIKCRFLCIDTPESTIDHDPWGKEASNFTAKRLKNANLIVLEAEMTNRKDVYGRYLAYVWVDGYLLNLELVDEAYTNAAAYNSKYRNIFIEAGMHAKKTGRRFYGELDPNYDYQRGDFK